MLITVRWGQFKPSQRHPATHAGGATSSRPPGANSGCHGQQDCIPQRQLVIYSSEHDGLDPFLPKGSRPSSRQTTTTSATATPRLFQVEVASALGEGPGGESDSWPGRYATLFPEATGGMCMSGWTRGSLV